MTKQLDKPNKTTLAAPQSAEARAAVEAMNDDLRLVYESLRRKLSASTVNDVLAHWEIGHTVSEVCAGTHKEKYGENALEKLATAFGCGTSKLYAARCFAIAFPKDELDELLKKRNIVGRPISYSDLLEISRLPKKTDRNKLITYFFKNDVASRALHIRASELLGMTGKTGRKATGITPRSPLAGLRAITRHAHRFAEIGTAFNKSVFEQIQADRPKYATEPILHELQEAEERLSELQRIVEEGLAGVSNAITDLSHLQQAGDAAPAESEDEAKPVRRAKVTKPTKLIKTVDGKPSANGKGRRVVRIVRRKVKPTAAGAGNAQPKAVTQSAALPAGLPAEEDALFAA